MSTRLRCLSGFAFAVAILVTWKLAQGAEMNASALLRAGDYQKLNEYYAGIQQKFDAGEISGDQLRDAFRAFYPTDRDLAVKFNEWVTAYPKSYVARLARGIYYKKVGLEERGERYISETSKSQIEGMDRAMTQAASDLGTSIGLDPKPFLSYFHTMDIGRQYVSNEQLRKVFDSAAALEPNSFGLRTKFMLALEPRWGGSTRAMRSFLEECRHTTLTAGELGQLEAMVLDEEGAQYRADGNLSGAEAAYRKALALGPCPCANVRNDLNNVLFDTHQYTAAIELLDQYLRETPTDLWALANRGTAKLGANRPQEAIVDLSAAAVAGDGFSQNQLGMLYLNGAGEVKPDYKQSVFWLSKAAAQGEAQAQALLPQAEALAAERTPAH
jgi:hypothetical protein